MHSIKNSFRHSTDSFLNLSACLCYKKVEMKVPLLCVCVSVVWRRLGRGLTSVRVQAPSCWMLWSAQEMSSSWISVPMATGSSTTVTTWRMLGSPAAPIQVHVHYTHINTHTLLHTDRLKAAIYSLWTSINHYSMKQQHPLCEKQDLWGLRTNISVVMITD